jgi:hypothetical protein
MPPQLLDLPTEILDECLAQLVPPLAVNEHPTMLSDALLCQPEPRDLCSVLSVCTVLKKLALPFIWRRVTLSIEDELNRNRLGRKHFSQWQPLCDHPGLATHTRVLFLDFTAFDEDDCDGTLDPRMLLPALRLLKNIRLVYFYSCGLSQCEVLDEVYTEIISKPHLHTFISSYFSTALKIPSLNSLSRLSCIELDGSQWIPSIKAAPHLESLAITEDAVDLGVLVYIPWTTLRQLELRDTLKWDRLLDGFTVRSLDIPELS